MVRRNTNSEMLLLVIVYRAKGGLAARLVCGSVCVIMFWFPKQNNNEGGGWIGWVGLVVKCERDITHSAGQLLAELL